MPKRDVLRKRLISQEFSTQSSDNAEINKSDEATTADDIISSIREVQEEDVFTKLIEFDKEATASLHVLQNYESESGLHLTLLTLFILCEIFGGAVMLIPVNLAVLLSSSNLQTFSFYLNLLLAQFYDETIKVLIKAIVARQRPGANDARFPRINKFSFPSGHSSRMGMLGFILISDLDRSIQFYLSFIFLAVTVCSSRVMLGRHYVSDVIGGFIIGTLNGVVFRTMFWAQEDTFERWFIKFVDLTESFGL